MKTKTPSTGEIIMSQACRAGCTTTKELAKRTGINYRTLLYRYQKGGWTLLELQAIDKFVHFEDLDIIGILRSKS